MAEDGVAVELRQFRALDNANARLAAHVIAQHEANGKAKQAIEFMTETHDDGVTFSEAGCKFEDVQGILELAAQKWKNSVRTSRRLQNCMDNIFSVSSILDVLALHHLEHLSIIWAMLKLLIMKLVDHRKSLTAFCDLISRFVDVLPKGELLVLFRHNGQQIASICLYVKILDFLLEMNRCVCQATKSPEVITLQFQRLQWGSMVKGIAKMSLYIDQLIGEAAEAESREIILPILATGAQLPTSESTNRRGWSEYTKSSSSVTADEDRSTTNNRPVSIQNDPVQVPTPPAQIHDDAAVSSQAHLTTLVMQVRPCYIMILIYLLVVLGSGALGVYYWVAKDRMGDRFTAASWFAAVAALVMALPAALLYPHCRCWPSWRKTVYTRLTAGGIELRD
ncbi:hypothetical protein GGR57DRAFT_518999 [Xylariaceae sp. FL1272]|nr:hypothetical protein GGR57DRAFT_518999 [Xylariaceae sp. FL1272]